MKNREDVLHGASLESSRDGRTRTKNQPVSKSSESTTLSELSTAEKFRERLHSGVSSSSIANDFLKPEWPIIKVRTAHQLEQLGKKLQRVKKFSLDTETWGPKVLSDQLCLIQISIAPEELVKSGHRKSATGRTFLVDVVALEQQSIAQFHGRNPLTPLRPCMENPGILKVIHHAQFEQQQLAKFGITLDGIVDTERLTKRIRSDLKSYSLQACVLEVLGKEMSKEEQTSKWIQRPLTPEQVGYAALDAEVVLRLESKLRTIEERATPRSQRTIATLLKHLGDAQRERKELLSAPEVYEPLTLLQVEEQQCRARLEEVLRAEAKANLSANYRGAYGIAGWSRLPVERVDFEKLGELLPDLASEVIQEKTTQKAVKVALETLGRQSEIKAIWDDINVHTGERTSPRLFIQTTAEADGVVSSVKKTGRKSKNSDVPAVDELPEITKEELLAGLLEAELGQLQIIRLAGIGDELAFIDTKIQKLSERIFERLEEQAGNTNNAEYSGVYGKASLTSSDVKKVDLDLFKAKYPEVAALAIAPHLTKSGLSAALRQVGADPVTAKSVVSRVFVKTTELGSPRISIRPNYALFYKGMELSPEDQELSVEDNVEEF